MKNDLADLEKRFKALNAKYRKAHKMGEVGKARLKMRMAALFSRMAEMKLKSQP